MVNSGVSSTTAANEIVITFTVVIIQSSITNGTSIWITGGVEYYNGDEIWISQTSLTYEASTVSFRCFKIITFLKIAINL